LSFVRRIDNVQRATASLKRNKSERSRSALDRREDSVTAETREGDSSGDPVARETLQFVEPAKLAGRKPVIYPSSPDTIDLCMF
jgi:GH25 family lysozyme M1 (1,4-beta-N-acetylmuramidase)